MPSQMPMAPMPYGMPDAEHEGEFSDYGAYMDAGYPYPEESPGPYPGQQTPSQTPHSLSQTQGSQAAGSYVPDPHAAHPFHGPAYVPGAHAPPGHGPGQYGAPAGYGYGTPTSGAVSPRTAESSCYVKATMIECDSSAWVPKKQPSMCKSMEVCGFFEGTLFGGSKGN